MGDGQSCSNSGSDSAGSRFLLTVPKMFTHDSLRFNLEQGFYGNPVKSLPPLINLDTENNFEALPGKSLDIGQPVMSGQTRDFYGKSPTASLTDLSNPNVPRQRNQNENVQYRPLDRKNDQGGPIMLDLGKTEALPSSEPSQATVVKFWETFDSLKDPRMPSFPSLSPANFPFSCKLSPLSRTRHMLLQHPPPSLQSAPPSTTEQALSDNEEKDLTFSSGIREAIVVPSKSPTILPERAKNNKLFPLSTPQSEHFLSRRYRENPNTTSSHVEKTDRRRKPRVKPVSLKQPGKTAVEITSIPSSEMSRTYGPAEKFRSNCMIMSDLNSVSRRKTKRKRCGDCAGCMKKDSCGKCAPCTNNKCHQVCKMRRCAKISEKKPKVFEEEPSTWEDKLDCVNPLFDVWNDVHRRWVYLEGIFTSNLDVKTLLPVETSRFHSISSEFLALMKKVSKMSMGSNVHISQDVQRSIERLNDILGKIHKTLGEYLQREKSSFPRLVKEVVCDRVPAPSVSAASPPQWGRDDNEKTMSPVRNGSSQRKLIGFPIDSSSATETVWLTSPSKEAKQPEKFHLRTSVQIEKLSKRTIEETCLGKWRCNSCGKIENSLYLLQLHKSTNCETGLSFNCEMCGIEIDDYSNFVIHYMEHDVDKKKKCPICLCTNFNNIKEHVIAKSHFSKDSATFGFSDRVSQMNYKKPKLAVLSDSAMDECLQDLEEKDPLSNEDSAVQNVKDSILAYGPHSPVTDGRPGFKTAFDVLVLHPEALPEESVMIRSNIYDIEDKDPLSNEGASDHNVEDSILAYGPLTDYSSVADRTSGFKTEVGVAVKKPNVLSEQSAMTRSSIYDLEEKDPLSNETTVQNVNSNPAYGPRSSIADRMSGFKSAFDVVVLQPEAFSDHSAMTRPNLNDLEEKDPLSTEDAAVQNVKDSILAYGPQSSVTDCSSVIESVFDVVVLQPEVFSEESKVTRPNVYDLEEKDPLSTEDAAVQNVKDSSLANGSLSSVTDCTSGFKSVFDVVFQQSEAFSKQSKMTRPNFYDVEDKESLSNEDASDHNVEDSILPYAPHSSVTDRMSGIKTKVDAVFKKADVFSELPVVTRPNINESTLLYLQKVMNKKPFEYYSFKIEKDSIIPSENGLKKNQRFRCDICGAIFKRGFSLKRHYLRFHINLIYVNERDLANCGIRPTETTETGLYKCLDCLTYFDVKKELMDHRNSYHINGLKPSG